MKTLLSKRKSPWPATAPMIVAALLRLVLMLMAYVRIGTRVMMQGDTSSYLEPGRNLIVHGVFARSGAPEIDRTPGYPLFAELTGMLYGNVLLTVCVQILVSLVSLLLVRRIAERLFPGGRAGVIAAWLFAVEPLSIVSTVRLMPETLFVALLLLCLDRVLEFERNGRLVVVAQGGLILAAATFVRPASYYLIFALAIATGVSARRRGSLWWKAPAILLACALPWLMAWQLRNYTETGYSGFSSIVEKNLYFFQSAEVSAELDHVSLEEEQRRLGYGDESSYLAVHPEQSQWRQAQRLRFMKDAAVQNLSQHFWLYLKSHLRGVCVVAFSPGATELLQLLDAYPQDNAMPHRVVNEGVTASAKRLVLRHPEMALVMLLLAGYLGLLYLGAIAGLLRRPVSSAGLLAVAGTALYFLLISGGAQAVARYRLPVMPELCVLAAGGLSVVSIKRVRGRRSSPAEEVRQIS